MILCLDVGNSQIFGGVFAAEQLKLRFRHVTQHGATSDQLGIFLKTVLKENNLQKTITQIAIGSVVPSIDYSLTAACKKYFNLEPFILQAGVDTGITNYLPETGADLIAGNLAAVAHYPNKNLIVVDLGTATTISVISQQRCYLGSAFLTGLKTSILALQNNTDKLPAVEIIQPQEIVSNSTIPSMQSGLYHGHLGAMREIIARITAQYFNAEKPIIIGTGGFAHLFENENIFDVALPDLVLEGLKLALSSACFKNPRTDSKET